MPLGIILPQPVIKNRTNATNKGELVEAEQTELSHHSLGKADGSDNTNHNGPQTSSFNQTFHANTDTSAFIWTIRSGAVGKSSIDEERLLTFVVPDVDERLVESIVSAVADKFRHCGVVLITAAYFIRATGANNRKTLFLVGGGVVEDVVVRVRV